MDSCLLGVGYCYGVNIVELNRSRIPYLLRLKAGNNIYGELVFRCGFAGNPSVATSADEDARKGISVIII